MAGLGPIRDMIYKRNNGGPDDNDDDTKDMRMMMIKKLGNDGFRG